MGDRIAVGAADGDPLADMKNIVSAQDINITLNGLSRGFNQHFGRPLF
jgi:hypothetical protein